MTRSRDEVVEVLHQVGLGRNDCEIARLTGIPRATVRDWRRGRHLITSRPHRDGQLHCDHDFSQLPPLEYSYLLGMYLGDGYIAAGRRGVWRLMVTTDSRYPGIIEECCRAMEAVLPSKRASCLQRASQCVDVCMWWKHWPCLFPQHGPGKKHERHIHLEAWQELLVCEAADSFVRGLIHSDGCRIIANDRGVASVRYHFTNRSEDIKRLFCWALDRLDIPWTRPCHRQIAIYRRAAVARLDEFVGPKC